MLLGTRSISFAVAFLVATLLVLATPEVAPAAPDAVGQVVGVFGDAAAVRPGAPGDRRPLACGDPLFAGDVVETAAGSGAAVLVGDALAHVGERSHVRVDRRGDAASVRLLRGAVRVVDTREEGAPGDLDVLGAHAALVGNDAEAYVFAEKTGQYAMLCEWDAPLAVERGDERAVAEPGRCVVAKRDEPLYGADAHEDRIAVPDENVCEAPPVALGLDRHHTPAAVAGPPPLLAFSDLPGGPALPEPMPCDVPGSGCNVGAGGFLVVEPPPSGGGFPGGN